MNKEARVFHLGTVLAFVYGDILSGKGMYLSLGGRQEVENFFQFMISYTFSFIGKDFHLKPELRGFLEVQVTVSLIKQFPQMEMAWEDVLNTVHSLRSTLDPKKYRELAFSTSSIEPLFAKYGERVEVARLGEINFSQFEKPSQIVEKMLAEVSATGG